MYEQVLFQLANFGAAGVVLMAIWVFITKYFWPWFSGEYWGSIQRKHEKEETVLTEIRDAIVAMKTLASTEVEERRLANSSLSTLHKTQEQLIRIQETLVEKLKYIENLTNILQDMYKHVNN